MILQGVVFGVDTQIFLYQMAMDSNNIPRGRTGNDQVT